MSGFGAQVEAAAPGGSRSLSLSPSLLCLPCVLLAFLSFVQYSFGLTGFLDSDFFFL